MCLRSKNYSLKTVITEGSVKSLSEQMAFDCLRAFMRFSPAKFFSDLYNDLVKDMLYKSDIRRPFSNGYDLVMEAYCFLYSNLGRRLSDITTVKKYGVLKPVKVLDVCALILAQCIRKDYFSFNCFDLDTLYSDEPRCEVYEYSECDWDRVDGIIAELGLNDKEKATLELLISGKSLSETARILSCGVSTVSDRRKKFQKKYMNLIRF